MKIKTYKEMIQYDTFEERFKYLQLHGKVGKDTFGFDRVFNQMFYKRDDWLNIRDEIIVRDDGCDLGIKGREIPDGVPIYVHHMNPINLDDIVDVTEYLLDPNYLVCTTKLTHDAIHYGDENTLIQEPIERKRNDTCPWRH